MRPSLIQCFPHPFTRQWPATGHPTKCECRQLYALVCVCCCVPNTHLLVLHESPHLNTNLITSMPKGPKYVDFVITPRTTAEDLCGFLVRADMAAAGHPFNAPGCSSAGVGAPITEEVSIFSPQSLEVSRHEAFGATDVPSSALESASQKTPSSPLSRNTVAPRQVVVVCLHGIADASATVQSALMDLLMFEQVQSHNRAVRTQALRIVAFCSSRNYAILLPEPLRALFTLSTYVSTLASDSAVVLQMASASSSNIVNKRFMIEVMTAPDGQALLKTVTLSSFVKRYLLHLLLVLRGSSVMGMSPGALALRRIPRWVTLLKALAILFMPDEELLRSRAPQTRSALLQTYTRTTMSATFERAAHLATQRAATTVPSTTLPERRAAQQEVGESQSVEAAGGLRQVDPSATSTEERSNTPQNGGGGKVAIESFSNVVVSPSDVACVLHCLVGHLITMPREVVPLEETVPSTGAMLGNTPGTGTLADAHWGMLDVHRHGNMEFSLQDPAMWDAVVASWPLRNLRGIANPALDIPMGGSSSTQYGNTPLDSVDNPEATGEVDWSLQRGNGALSGNCLEQDSRATPSPKTHEQYFQTLNSRTFFSVLEAWKWTAQNKFGVLDVSTTPMLDYCEVREVMRATLVSRSAPAPG
ncbi:hypothetical protein JKF63_00281 [Porcisia hertigi]|uniref:Uncharacterized protein n=1 Tax=Porcisia hertigi TaxID=2761500 RepID=A0A836KY70_9TRYP|nr:hypothetical protein JKF63_00281 [Porcisia hertigi]